MKKILVAFLAVLVAVGYSHANGIEPASPVGMSIVKSGHVVKLFYRGEKSGKVKVSIYNHEGRKVFTEVMSNTEHFMRPYNFSLLPEGTYRIELADESGSWAKTVNYTSTKPRLFAHLTRLNDLGDKYMLAVPGSASNELTIRIYDERQKLVFEETQAVEGNFARLYNLSEVPGTHTFEIWDANGQINRLSKK